LFILCSKSNEVVEKKSSTSYDITPILSKFEGTGLNYQINSDRVIFTTDDLPNHTSPYWDENNPLYENYNGTNQDFNINPNRILSQNITLSVTLYPGEASSHSSTPLGAMGVSRNGVVFYNQYAGPDQPLTREINSFDQWLGHPQPQGAYHYHLEPKYLTNQFGQDAFLGILADGFPVYGPVENGQTIYSSDLDIYHGHTSPTNDFPEGIYHYHITSDDPYINGSGFYGTPGNISN
jgi:hypothetical protein